MTPENILKKLKQLDTTSEVHHVVSTFKIFRSAKNTRVQEVTVEIWDAGPDASSERYLCRAISNDGKTATGNPQNSIENAILHTHWDDLDKTA